MADAQQRNDDDLPTGDESTSGGPDDKIPGADVPAEQVTEPGEQPPAQPADVKGRGEPVSDDTMPMERPETDLPAPDEPLLSLGDAGSAEPTDQAGELPDVFDPEATVVGQAPRDIDPTGPLPPWSDADATAPLGRQVPDADATAPLGGQVPDAEATQAWGAGEDATMPVPPVSPVPPTGSEATSVLPPTDDIWTGRAGIPEPAMRDAVPAPEPGRPRDRTWWTPLLLALLALALVALVALGAWLALRNNEPAVTPSASPTPLPTTAAATSPVPSPVVTSPVPEPVVVPLNLIGMTQTEATTALDALELIYQLRFEESDAPPGTVISSDPAPGTAVAPGTKVVLTLAVPLPSPSPSPSPSPEPSPEPSVTETP